MNFSLTEKQRKFADDIRQFVSENIVPNADRYDQQENTPDECIELLAEQGILGAIIPEQSGGLYIDSICYGTLCREIGRASASLLSLLTVHSMVSVAIMKWGTPQQRETWLPALASGKTLAAFGLTEPNVGSHASGVETAIDEVENGFVINGTKKWISFAQKADLFLIVGQCENKPTAFLVERDTAGVNVEPITGVVGFRSAMLGEIQLRDCKVPKENMLGKIGFGFSHVAGHSLDLGRLSIAWGCLGLSQACLDASLDYSSKRRQGNLELSKYQLIQEMIAEMVTNVQAMRLLCAHASYLRDTGDPGAIMETCVAKYFASRMANKCASDALQIHGANGCSMEHPVQRYWRDARIMEIIEGSTQIQQLLIAKYGYQNLY